MRRVVVALGIAVLAGTYARVYLAERTQRRADHPGLPDEADAIIVFGGKCYDRGPAIEVRERLNHAIALWDQHTAPTLLVSGGLDGDVDEVEIMRRYVVRSGVPEAAVGEARPGDNTRLTITCLDPTRVYVAVSSAYHAHRISTEARRQGKRVFVNCVPDSIDLRNRRVLRVRRASEVAGCLLYATPQPIADPARRALGRLRHDIPNLLTPS